nr:hypothetical protein [Tanacetum cinerariifolium]
MSTLTFAKTYNLIEFLEKPTESDEFDQIFDFLNANPIKYALTVSPTIYTSCIKQFWTSAKYALTVSPTIYTSCIKQFWTSAKVKTVNEDVRLQALVDGKKVIVNEASIRHGLRLDDAEGIACLPNDAIFEELARMGYEKPSLKLTFYKAFFLPQWKFLIHTIMQFLIAKTTAWNEFSSTMASAIICLATNQKFNFSKYILDKMMKNLEAEVKFYMFLRFVQVFVNHQLGDMSHHKEIFVNPSLTKKVFANMKRVGTGFFGAITPLFETMMVQAPDEVGTLPTPSHDPLPSGEDRLQLNELMEICTKSSNRVLSLEQTKTNQAAKIKKLQKRVKKLEGKKKKRTQGLKRMYKVGLSSRIVSSDEEDQGRINDHDMFGVNELDGDELVIDDTTGENVEQDATITKKEVSTTADKVVTTAESIEGTTAATTLQISKDDEEERGELSIEEKSKLFVKLMNKRKNHFERLRAKERRRKPPTKAQKRNQMCTYLKNMAGFTHNQLKSKSFEEVQQAFNKTMDWINSFVAMDSKAVKDRAVESSKRVGDEIEQESTKKQKLDKNVQAEVADDDIAELKRCLEIVLKDDVTIEATPLSSTSPTIVDYKIYKEGKKSYFKIIRADGNSQNYLTFGTMFKNFNTEDL